MNGTGLGALASDDDERGEEHCAPAANSSVGWKYLHPHSEPVSLLDPEQKMKSNLSAF